MRIIHVMVCLASTKHINSCSGEPLPAVIEPRQRRRCVAFAQRFTLGENLSKNGHNPKVMPVTLNCPLSRRVMARRYMAKNYCFTTRYVFVAPLSVLRRKRYIPAGNEEVFTCVSAPSNTPEATTTPCTFNNVYVPHNSPFTIRN